MRYLELSLTPGEERLHPLFSLMAESDAVEEAWMLDWNVAREDTTTTLFRIRGDRTAVTAALDTEDVVREYSVESVTDREFYLFKQTATVPVERQLWLAFNQRRSVLMPPLEYRDGMVVCRIVGTHDELSTAIEEIPDGIEVDIRRLGRFRGDRPGIRTELTDRQREAVEAAIDAGYYEVPREATSRDVAAALDCDPSTASELLRRAEATVLELVFGDPSPTSV